MLLRQWLGRLALQSARRRGCIGLDLGAERLHAVQLQRDGDALTPVGALSLPLPSGLEALLESREQLKRCLRPLWQRGGLHGRRVVTAMPPAELRLMVLNYRGEAEAAEPERILQLAEERIREPLDRFVVDYVPIRTSGQDQGEKSALVALAEEESVVRHLERLRGAGLEVEALEIAPVAVRRLVAWLHRDLQGDAVLVLHFGRERSELTVIWGRRLLLYRAVDLGERHVLERICKALDLDAEAAGELLGEYGICPASAGASSEPGREIGATLQELARPCLQELAAHAQKAISYTAFQTRGTTIERAHLLGGAALWPGLAELLASLLSIPVAPLDPLSAVSSAGAAAAAAPTAFALATGHALRGLSDE